MPFDVFSELSGALFDSGGFPYSLYLNGHLVSKKQMRATQGTLTGCSTFARLGPFLLVGLYAVREPWLFVACLLPGMAPGS